MLIDILIPILIFIGLGLFAGVLLSVFSKAFAVETDERVSQIIEVLPGLNCGVCGFSGCENYANELVNKDVETNRCIPGGDSTSAQISTILGKDFEDVVETIAYVHCGGEVPKATNDVFEYYGERTCTACNMYYQGKGTCNYGCIGYGDCVNECAYGAISIIDEIAVIDPNKCKGCTMCVAACPKKLIEMRDATKKVYVKCNSCDNGKKTINTCKNGCIGCKKCEKNCPTGAIVVENNLARIDYDKCINCLECAHVCPVECIEII